MKILSSFQISCLINAISTLSIGSFVLWKNKKSIVNLTFFLLNLVTAIWSIGMFIEITSLTREKAFLVAKIFYVAVFFIPVFYSHFILSLFNLARPYRVFIYSGYVSGLFLSVLDSFNLVILDVRPIHSLSINYFAKPGPFYNLLLIIFGIYAIVPNFAVFKQYKTLKSYSKNQYKYIFIASLLAFGGGSTSYLPVFNIRFYPYPNFLVSLYPLLIAYAILKYQLMDIKVAITRGGIFLFVYAFVLGIPFAIGYHTKSWFLPTFLMAVLASWGPFVYGRLRKKAEDIILAHQRKYQKILLQAAEGMSRQRNLNHLLKLIVYIIKKTVNPTFAAVFFQENGNFYIKAARGIKREHMDVSIARDSPLMQYIFSSRRPLNVEEMPPAARQYLENIFSRRIELVIPAFIEDSLVAFMVLGNKKDGVLYSASDMEIFEILSHQASLAMENCLLWEKERKRLVRKEQELRMASLDHFSASLAHEIDNPIQAISGMAELALSHLDSSPDFYLRDKLQRIVNNSCRVSRMIKAIREFSSQTEGEHTILRIEDVISGFEEVISPQLKIHRVILEKEIERDLPLIKGNKIHLEEVLVNLASNSIHALEKKEKKVIKLRVYRKDPRTLRIEFSDNGYGIEKKMLSDIFLDFVTTKASTEGQGLGLARVRKIITQHSGRIWAESEGKDKGATFFIELPLAG